MLASVDEAHETLSGPATQKLLQRAFYDFGEERYARLAQLSVAHLYRLRQSRTTGIAGSTIIRRAPPR